MRLAAGSLALVLCACASSAELERESRTRVQDDLQRRGVAELDASIDKQQARALLEDGLSEDDAVRLALGHNRRTRAALARLGVGAGELAAAGLWANPVFNGQLLFFDGGTEIDLGISQSIGRTLLMPLLKRKSQAEQRELEATVTIEVLDAVHRARAAHVQATLAWRDLELLRAQESSAQGAEELMRDLEQAGNVTPVRVAATAAEWARQQLETLEGERTWLHAQEELQRACGLEDDPWELRPEALVRSLGGRVVDTGLLEGLDLENIEARVLQASLPLAASRARIDAQAEIAGLSGWKGRWMDSEVGVAALKEADSGSYGLGPALRIPLPVVDAGGAAAHAARARLESLIQEHEALALELRSKARETRERLRALAASEKHAREVLLPAERRLLEETLRNFNAMQVGAFDVLRVRIAEIDAERAHVNLLSRTRLARLELEALLAGTGHAKIGGNAP
jgi:cobalt-zinc-cadmium efflux system outer membrane protein